MAPDDDAELTRLRAEKAALVEAAQALIDACDGEVEEVFGGEIGNELRGLRAALLAARETGKREGGSVSAYLLPDGNVQIAFSGGRTSAYMLHQILEANGGLRDGVEVTFQNTGREMPETLDFVAEVGLRWGVPITWLEYRAEAPRFAVVTRETASENGEPFEALIRRRKFLPNQQARFCTAEMKVHASTRYARSIGWDRWTKAIGIRADEPRRLGGAAPRERFTVWYPLAAAGVSRQDVGAFWQSQPFDLMLPNVGGNCWLGNCDGCFLKSEAHVAALAREAPERAAWWERMEALATTLSGSGGGATFSKRYTRREMREFVEKQGDWIFSAEAAALGVLCQADGGECT